MEREYLRRQNSGPQRRPRLYFEPNQRGRPPWIVWVLLALAAIVLTTILIVRISPEENQADEESSASLSSAWEPMETNSGAGASMSSGIQEHTQAFPEPLSPQSEPYDCGSLMIIDGAGYAYYHFSEDATNDYILALDSAGQALSGSTTVYSLVVPTSIDVMISENYLTQYNVNSSDQKKALDSYLIPSINAINPQVKTVALFDALRQHCNESIYFGSDRTWTQLGSYYAYVEFCKSKGLQPISLESCSKEEYDGFLGGLAVEAGEAALNPDTVVAYFPSGNTSLRYYDENGELVEWPVVHSGDGYDPSLLYLIFAAGDHAYKELVNSDLTDNSACVVVQDSFGNYFIPFLTAHYQHVYVVDYRYFDGSAKDLALENNASDMIILNSILATSDPSAVEMIANLF